ncbi:MAG: PQQ-binding-like beta-propeller repeat protein [Planctomycetes bacterium]|nr:PQQ-binding-like beta-propeller repeat protein [Planctomycetota bacterium]
MAGKSFKGNLEILNLSDIFQSLAMNRHSGTLVVNDGKREKKIYFAEGEITLLSSNRRQRLGEMLIASGKITEEDLDLALKLQKQSRKKLGEILVEEGFCADEDIYKLVRMQIEEEIYDLFLWRKADFEFIADQIPDDMAREAPNLTRLALNTNSLIMEALRRLDEWNLMQDLVPTTKEVFVVADGGVLDRCRAGLPERLDPDQIDGKTTVEGLGERFFMSEFELCKHLAELVREGALRPLGRDELVERAEEAYALNDFPAAAALYGRLAEYFPGQAKVLVPLADSLRRTGADRLALGIYEDLAKQLEQSGRDLDRLRQCYEAITQLDPTRQDMARKLEELELRQASAPRRLGLWPVLVVLVLAAAGGGYAARDRIMAWLKPPPDPSRAVAAQLLEEMIRRKANRDYQGWFEKAVQLWQEHPTAPEMKKVELPLLIATEPPGLDIYVNGYFQGTMGAEAEFQLCSYDPANRVRVEVKAPKREGRDEQRVLWTHTFEDPKRWNDVVKVAIYDDPDGSFIGDGWLDTPLAHTPGAHVGASRDGRLRALRIEGRSVQTVPGLDGVTLGERGDTFSPPALSGDLLLVGLVEGGVVGVDLAAAPGTDPLRRGLFPADAPVVARPLVLPDGKVVVATRDGDVVCYPPGGGAPRLWADRAEAGVDFDPAFAAAAEVIVVAAGDARVHAWRPDGRRAWGWHAPALLDGPAVPLGDSLAVPLQTGKVVLLDAATGRPREAAYDEPGQRLVLLADPAGAALFVANHQGAVRALDPASLRPLWKTEYRRVGGKGRPCLARFRDRLVVAGDAPHVYALHASTGRIAWQARFPEQAGRAVALSATEEHLLVATTKNYLHVFDREDH